MIDTADGAPKYQVEDRSLLLGFYKRLLWDRLTEALPRTLSPNVLTIASQVSAVLAATSCAAGERHPGLYALSAVGFLVALTLDNIDGAHARRTGQCSALGELLDHGLDGVTATATLVTTGFLLHAEGVKLVMICALGGVAFATVFWEQFRTGILRLPRISPTEGLTLIAIWELLAALFGDPKWLRGPVSTIALAGFIIVHVLAILTPIKRVGRGAELVPLFVFAAMQLGFALRGALAAVPAITIGLAAASMTSHLLILRRHRRPSRVVPRGLYAASLPFLFELVVPHPTLWSSLSLAIVVADYAARLVREGRRL